MGTFIRYIGLLIPALFVAIVFNLLIRLEVTWSSIAIFFQPTLNSSASIWSGVRSALLIPIGMLGPGCATTLTLASYNQFRVRSDRITHSMGAFHFLIMLLVLITGRLALDHFEGSPVYLTVPTK